MKRIHLLILAVSLVCVHPLDAAETSRSVSLAAKPNILFILTDDQRWNTLGCMGETNILTPNIDRLAHQGVLFQNHFVTTSICCSSRASIFTGQYTRRHGVRDFATALTGGQWAETYPALLRQAGYRTGFIGKFGVGNRGAVNAMADKFDYWKGVPGQGGTYFIDPKDPNRKHETAKFGADALEFIGGATVRQPFCLSVSFTAPHARDNLPHMDQFTPDDRDQSLYTNRFLPQPPTMTDAYFHKLPRFLQGSNTVARERYNWRFNTTDKYEHNAKNYYRLISGIDREVGRMMAELEQRGLTSNTVVIFTSDNGYFLGDRQLSDKFYMYEESLRDPLVIYDPRQPAANRGRREQAMSLNIDFAPTLLALAGLPVPARMQGRSLVPLLTDARPAGWRTQFYYEEDFLPARIPPSRGVRTENWAYIEWTGEKPPVEQLFDVQKDPLEGNDLARVPEFAQKLAQLRAQCVKYSAELK